MTKMSLKCFGKCKQIVISYGTGYFLYAFVGVGKHIHGHFHTIYNKVLLQSVAGGVFK